MILRIIFLTILFVLLSLLGCGGDSFNTLTETYIPANREINTTGITIDPVNGLIKMKRLSI